MSSTSYYPPVGFHFEVRMTDKKPGNSRDGSIAGSFQEVSGISMEIKTEDVTEGGVNGFVHKLPQSVQYPPLVLKRGLVIEGKNGLHKWWDRTKNSSFMGIEKKILIVNLLSPETHEPIMSWCFYNAYPVKYEISNFNAANNEIVVQTMQFAYTYFDPIYTDIKYETKQ